ncbi:MAG: hypothetical protein WD359_05550 [Dehalococcoidia bacterium]
MRGSRTKLGRTRSTYLETDDDAAVCPGTPGSALDSRWAVVRRGSMGSVL